MPLPVLLTDRLCGETAAQAEAEVERSEGEGEAQGRPVLGWAICRCLGVRAAGHPWVLWVARRRVLTVRWYGVCQLHVLVGPPGACEEPSRGGRPGLAGVG